MRSYYYVLKNRKRSKIFIFTDSRGYEVTKLWNKKNPFSSYIGDLIKEFRVDYHICEYSSTTIIDFLYEYDRQLNKGKVFDFVIMHVGLVDFSPRPKSMAIDILKAKAQKIKHFRWDVNVFEKNICMPISTEIYNNEKLANLYDEFFLKNEIIPLINKIPNLIYIGCNPVLQDWRGNYWQDRPRDISQILMSYNKVMLEGLTDKEIINIEDWGRDEIKEFTVDNIHLNRKGYDQIFSELKKKLRVNK